MIKSIKMVVAVVVYNMNCHDSLTCNALEQIQNEDLKVVIYDNSTRNFGNMEYCKRLGWDYLGGQGNVGISKAYNAVIDDIQQEPGVELVCLFDDDTQLEPEYFTLLQEAVLKSDANIFTPLIYSGNKLISPSRISPSYQIRLFDTEQQALTYEGMDKTAINSGMALRLSLFEHYRYDENIFLDGVDHKFLSDMRQRGEKICVFPYCCNHMFSGNSMPSKESAISRFRILKKDYNYILKNNRSSYWSMMIRRVLHLTYQYRTSVFIRILLQKNN